MTISRSDLFPPSESGGEVFEELAKLLSKEAHPNTVQELLNAISNKRSESVSDVVARYREETGLDLVLSENEVTVKTASPGPKNEARFLSKRQKTASEAPTSILTDPKIVKDIESLCSCSGGHKSLHAIIESLRSTNHRNDISYTDPELNKFIEECQAKHKESCPDDSADTFEVGQIGTQQSNDEDRVADYFKSGR
jgi:hypothetical protein